MEIIARINMDNKNIKTFYKKKKQEKQETHKTWGINYAIFLSWFNCNIPRNKRSRQGEAERGKGRVKRRRGEYWQKHQ